MFIQNIPKEVIHDHILTCLPKYTCSNLNRKFKKLEKMRCSACGQPCRLFCTKMHQCFCSDKHRKLFIKECKSRILFQKMLDEFNELIDVYQEDIKTIFFLEYIDAFPEYAQMVLEIPDLIEIETNLF